MKIQMISNACAYDFEDLCAGNKLSEFEDLDMYDINIIDVSNVSLWKYSFSPHDTIKCVYDFTSLKQAIEDSQTSTNIILLPQNHEIEDPYDRNCHSLKDKLNEVKCYALDYLFESDDILMYQNSVTSINDENYPSSFVFKDVFSQYEVIARNVGSNSPTVIKKDRLILTTLGVLFDEKRLLNFLKGIGLITYESEPVPEWLNDYEILDDAKQKEIINDKKAQIEEAEKAIKLAEEKLEENKEFKSILYENGDSLVEHVYRILQELLDCDLTGFIDEKKEDFNIRFDNVTFIGEIKGVTSNVKSEHISQLDVHCQGYKDKLQEENKEENVKGLLVINPLRNKPLEDREPIHEQQIALAKRNESLIIETKILLELFERFRGDEMDTNKITEVFRLNTGLLKMEAF